MASQCIKKSLEISNAPLETPSHNGEYRGTAPVRIIPPGVFGSDFDAWGKMARVAAKRGREKQHARAEETPRPPCAHCGSTEDKWTEHQKKILFGKGCCRKFCQRLCQSRYYSSRRDKNADNEKARGRQATKTKWG